MCFLPSTRGRSAALALRVAYGSLRKENNIGLRYLNLIEAKPDSRLCVRRPFTRS